MIWVYLALSAAVFSSIAVVLQKEALNHEHAIQNALVIALGQMLLSLLLIPFAKFNAVPIGSWILVIAAGAASTAANIFQAKAIRHLEISFVAPLYAIGTVMLVLAAGLFLGERLLPAQYLGIGAVLAGAYVVDFDGHRRLLDPILDVFREKYIAFNLFAVICFTAALFFAKPAVDHFDPLAFLIIQNFCVAIGLLSYAGRSFKLFDDVGAALKSDWHWQLALAVATFAQTLLVLWAVRLQDVSLVIPVYRLWILGAVILGGRLFHEHNLKFRLLGAGLMLLGVAVVVNPALIAGHL